MNRLDILLNRAWDAFNQADFLPFDDDWDSLICAALHSTEHCKKHVLRHLVSKLKLSDLESTRELAAEIATAVTS